MSKAEKFIDDYTRNCSNLLYSDCIEGFDKTVYQSWLTPDQARRAVEIEREEIIKQTTEWLAKHAIKYYINSKGFLGTDELIKDYKIMMSMKE